MRFSLLVAFGTCASAFALLLNMANAEGKDPPKTEAVVKAVAVAESGAAVEQFDNFPRPFGDRPPGDRPPGNRPPGNRPPGGDNCMFRGQDCKRNDDCCSGNCDGRGRDRKCAPPSGPPSRPPPRPRCKSRGDDCIKDDECCIKGDVCNGFRRNTCNEPRPKCKSSGDRCERDNECCNRREICTGPFRNTCKEPKPKCKFAGDDCKEDDDCCSKQCSRSGRSRKSIISVLSIIFYVSESAEISSK